MSLISKKHRNIIWIFIPVFIFPFLFPQFSGASGQKLDVIVAPNNFSAAPNLVPGGEAPQKPAVIQIQGGITAPVLNARAVLIYDPESNQNLFQKNPDAKLPIASLTKLMTAIVASEGPAFNKPIVITKNDRINVAPTLHLKAGDKVMPSDLLKAMLIGSANDAAQALANHFPDSAEFVRVMNLHAEMFGMKDTHFSTPIGFDTPGNYSSADDLKVLVNYAIDHLPFQEIWQQKNYAFISETGHKYYIANSNNLVLNHPNILSIKTGNTAEALGSMIVLAKNNDGKKIISLVIGSDNREKDTLTAVDYVFKNFSWNN